jgi:hypothetical protein
LEKETSLPGGGNCVTQFSFEDGNRMRDPRHERPAKQSLSRHLLAILRYVRRIGGGKAAIPIAPLVLTVSWLRLTGIRRCKASARNSTPQF